MFQARIYGRYGANYAVLGPTESRDEAARLARAWLEAHARTERPWEVTRVEIRATADDAEEVGS